MSAGSSVCLLGDVESLECLGCVSDGAKGRYINAERLCREDASLYISTQIQCTDCVCIHQEIAMHISGKNPQKDIRNKPRSFFVLTSRLFSVLLSFLLS